MPVLAIFTSLVIGALIIWLTTGSLNTVWEAYSGLFAGAFGSPIAIAGTFVKSTPYIFAGLAVALAFKCGLFNIGAEGQLALGSLFAAFVGYSFHLPAIIHVPLALGAGMLGGFLWGASRLPQGPHRRARSHHHDHDELPGPAVRRADVDRPR